MIVRTARLGKRPSFTEFDALADSIFKKQMELPLLKIAQHFKTTRLIIYAALKKLKFSVAD